FYQFACGTWMKQTPIPADRPYWLRSFSVIQERNEATLRQILEADATGKSGKDDPYAQKLGDFYATCMDEEKAETASMETLRAELARVDAIRDGKGLARALATLHLANVDALFGFSAVQDFKQSNDVIGHLTQGGLGLPDRDYYLKDDEHSVTIRKQYAEHVEK